MAHGEGGGQRQDRTKIVRMDGEQREESGEENKGGGGERLRLGLDVGVGVGVGRECSAQPDSEASSARDVCHAYPSRNRRA